MSYKPLIIAIGGKQRAGKGTVIECLQMELGAKWQVCSTSDCLIQRAASQISHATGQNVTEREILSEKSRYRPYLQKLGAKMEEEESAQVMKLALKPLLMEQRNFIIFESIRRASEYAHAKSLRAQLVLVDASEEIRKSRAGGVINPNDQTEIEGYEAIKKDSGTWIIKNEGDIKELRKEVFRFVNQYKRANRI